MEQRATKGPSLTNEPAEEGVAVRPDELAAKRFYEQYRDTLAR